MNDLERAQQILIVGALAAVARFLFADGPLSPRALLANVCLAAMIGWVGVLIAEWQGYSAGQVGIVVGVLAWLGPTALTELGRRFVRNMAKSYLDKDQ